MDSNKTAKQIKQMRGQFSQKVMAFNRFHTGKAGAHAESVYEVASRILMEQGVPRRKGISAKDFCAENHATIFSQQKGKTKPSRSEKKAGSKKITAVPATNKVAFSPVKQTVVIGRKEYLASEEFLSSYEWRKLRMQAIKLHGAKCQCCGASPATGAVINVDHIKPRRLFPELSLDIENLQVLCAPCNHGKGNWDQTDWRQNRD